MQLERSAQPVSERLRFGGTMAARNRQFILLCLLPATAALLAVIAYPLGYGFFLSLTDANPLSLEQEFIGFENYRDILGDSVYQNSLWLTIRFTAIIIAIEFPLAMILALMLNEPIRGRAVYRALLLIPWVMPNVVAAIIWGWIYSPDFGLLNFALAELHLIDSYYSDTGDMMMWEGSPQEPACARSTRSCCPSPNARN